MTLGDEVEGESLPNIVEDIEEGEAPGLCAVCCQLEPPGFDPDAAVTGDSECSVRVYHSAQVYQILYFVWLLFALNLKSFLLC